LEWIAPSEGRIAALTALAATVQPQSSVVGLARDPVAVTGLRVLSGTWAVVGFTTLTSPPGAVSDGLGLFLVITGPAMMVPAAAAVGSTIVPATVVTPAGTRFAVTGIYPFTGSCGWKAAARWVELALAAVAFYAALVLEGEAARQLTELPSGRHGPGWAAMDGDAPM
jgi:hypothetical protein